MPSQGAMLLEMAALTAAVAVHPLKKKGRDGPNHVMSMGKSINSKEISLFPIHAEFSGRSVCPSFGDTHHKYHQISSQISSNIMNSAAFWQVSLPFPKISRLHRCCLLGLGLALWLHLRGLGLLAPLGQSRLLLRRMC